jgi:hypothetical protein
LCQMYHRHRNLFRHTKCYFYVTLVKWKPISFCLEIVLILRQYMCTICPKCSKGNKIALGTPNGTPR